MSKNIKRVAFKPWQAMKTLLSPVFFCIFALSFASCATDGRAYCSIDRAVRASSFLAGA
ncbi:MAG: hypothetical protein LBO04_03520 [Spirochaetaceae bacterium]|nr:hypothetical protein [Spirochaetaceae bacterium]